MANPKYAELPGIAHDQPDLYETSDLPESEQVCASDVIVDQSESVEQLNIAPSEAFNRFKGKTLDSENVDFTDSIGYHRKTGYDIRAGDWEMLGEGCKKLETPQQTYHRLQYEIKELLEHVNQIKEASEEDTKASKVSPVILAEQIETLQKELVGLNMEQILGTQAITDLCDPQGALHKKLLSQLESFKKGSVTEEKIRGKAAVSSEGLTYELFVKPEQSKMEETAKAAELEQRLKSLENVIGQDKAKLSLITTNTNDKSVNAVINILSAKLNILDPGYLDQIESRLVLLHQCMQQVVEKKQQIEDVDKQNKVFELYELAKRAEAMSASLPQVVERLIALKELHEQALQFSKALTQLDTVQQQISLSLKNNEKILKELQDTFIKNSEVIEKNITSLNSRMTALKK